MYLALMFGVSTFLRIRQYAAILGLVRAFRARWPKLFELVMRHQNIFLTWGTFLPLALSGGLWLLQTLVRYFVFPRADEFTAADLLAIWPAVPLVLLAGIAMIGFDGYCAWNVGEIKRDILEKYFDQAEYWLRSWTAPVVHAFTFGYVNPRQIVQVEVRNALVSSSRLLNSALWYVSVQCGLRILFGLTLWMSYALEPWLRTLLG
jgi:hypothetical protein